MWANAPLGAQVRREFAELHMGVSVRAVLYAPDDRVARVAARAAFARIAELEEKMSDYRPESEVRRLERRSEEWVPVSADLFAVLSRALEVARASSGAFDPTVGPVVALWREARRTGRLPDPAELVAARDRVGWNKVVLDSVRCAVRLTGTGMRIDLGGVAKGYVLQQALEALRAHGVTRALIEAGGDIVVGDPPPGRRGWRVDTPGADSTLAARASALANAAISTSGPTFQFLEIDGVRYSHVVDPRTGMALTNGYLATVVARDGAIADALASALTVLAGEGVDAVSRVLKGYPTVLASVRRGPVAR